MIITIIVLMIIILKVIILIKIIIELILTAICLVYNLKYGNHQKKTWMSMGTEMGPL